MADVEPKAPFWYERSVVRWSFLGVIALVMVVTILSSMVRLPTNALGHFNRGIADTDAGSYDSAIDNLTRAIELDSGDEEYFYARGYARNLSGDHTGAMEDYEEAVRLAPGLPHVYIYRGYGNRMLGLFDEAVRDYDRAIELNPTIANAYSGRGSALNALGDETAAHLDFNKAIQLEPGNGAYHLKQADLFYDRGDWQQALYEYRRCHDTVETEREMNHARLLGWASRARLGDIEGADADLDDYLERRRKLGGVNDWFWRIGQFVLRKYEEGALFESAGSNPVRLSEASYFSSVVALTNGDVAGSLRRLRELVGRGPDVHYTYQRARKELQNRILGLRATLAMEVSAIREGGAAGRSGIAQGDRLLSIGGVPATQAELDRISVEGAPGTVLAVEIERDGETREIDLTLG